MYVPRHHELPGSDAALALIEAHPLGAWVVPGADGLVANHLPFLLDRSRGKFGTLLGHVSRANPVWRQLDASRQSIVMFQGPDAYITPAWYPGKREHGKVVPTWNYEVAHAHGVARAIHDEGWLRDLLARLTSDNEAERPMPWSMADAPSDFIDRLLRAVVGIEIPIDDLVGKRKASQDEELQDRWGTVEGLMAEGSDNALAMASLVRNAIGRSEGV
ncbi:FMN-binding negative transcriptional regulator [Variovorax ginsengisoli]|uniref:FMN-binding negative transcriptional regulator n=1 Tax=Variovorax ginsengisoli TaxID=363844 RepID=A0ABT8SDR6_9BURK|nr:FMN-binding negative transcriptional regulator [Variovorax ginsengisoli]MDN8616982.1 FMN-binding negative transcriptional regulator [Variovorax ginsengisoli]MDO1536152.1 FMN-binding negative transcriptional regulator [Variovorax ginsengisoli]